MAQVSSLGWRMWPYRLLRRFGLPPLVHWWAARLLNDTFLMGVMGIIQNEQGQVLLFQHTYRRQPWGFPGGWMTRGESPLAALEREVREESGLQVQAQQLLLIGITTERPKMEFVVRGRLLSGEFRPSSEVSGAGWYALEDPPEKRSPRLQAILERVRRLAPAEVGYYDLTWVAERAAD